MLRARRTVILVIPIVAKGRVGLRVLVIFSSSQLGGAERSLTRMAVSSQLGDVAFDLATMDGPGPWSEWCTELGVTPLIFGRRREDKKHGKFGAPNVWRAVWAIRKGRYSAVYVIGLRASLILRLCKPLLAGARVVHGVRWNPASLSRLDRAFAVIERGLGWLVDLYISNSRVAALTLCERLSVPRTKVVAIHNGLAALPKRQTAWAERKKVVVTLANLAPRKGLLAYLDNVILPIVSRRDDVEFLIAGRDEMGGKLQARIAALGIAARVRYLGFVQDVSSLLEPAKVFILPSLSDEGCPTSILEAMANGVVPIAFAIDGIPELVSNGEDGILLTAGDYVGMKSALENVLDRDDLGRRLSEAAVAKVAANFLMKHCVAAHQTTFERLIGS